MRPHNGTRATSTAVRRWAHSVVVALVVALVFAIGGGRADVARAAPVPTPAPATATSYPAPVPQSVPYVFAPTTVVSSGQQNANNFAFWSYLDNTLLPALNSTTYACGPCVVSVVAGSGISVAQSAASAGYGTSATIGNTGLLSLSATAPIVTTTGQSPQVSCNLCARTDVGQTFAGSNSFSGAAAFGSSVQLTSTAPLTLGTAGTGNIQEIQLANTSGATASQHVTLVGSNNGLNQCAMSRVSGSVLCVIDSGNVVALAMDASGSTQVAGNFFASLLSSSGGQIVAGAGQILNFCANNACGNAYVDTSYNMHAVSFVVASARAVKRDIRPLETDPLAIVRTVHPKWWNYRREKRGMPQHLGLVADDTDPAISGPHRDRYDVGALAVVDAAAISRLEARIIALEADLRRVRARPVETIADP